MRPVWAEINLGAIAHNVREIRRIIKPNSKIMAIVKANAYGHGASEVSRIVLQNGADFLGVAILDEALYLRTQGFKVPILVLGYTPPQQAQQVVEKDISQTIYTLEQAEVLSQAALKTGNKARLHIKIDTGMSRIGFLPNRQAVETLVKIARLPRVIIEGLYTHFVAADQKDKSFTKEQLTKFLDFNRELEKAGLYIPLKHAANSAATIELEEANLDMVRPGIILYGMYPSEQVQKNIVLLKQAISLKAQIAHVKEVEKNTSISYGRNFITKSRTIVVTLPLGYADGYSRLLANKGEVLLNGQRVHVIGRICMDQLMVDATEVADAKIGDEVVLIGQQGSETITPDELAHKLGTINYEITCMISARVPRVYTV
ncbi:MAG: alanine racemase [Firmicutes bacterium HGW-Firmicutes-12]|nr:MAG: alanine racemase [Firmicutes bacterium HGW-Firmicutes-12]